MAHSAPHPRTWAPGRFPVRLATLALALMLALAIIYVAVVGAPFARTPSTPTYQTAQASQGSVQATVSATGPITTLSSVPLTFKTSGQLAEIDVGVGQTITAGQVLAREDTTDLQAAVDQAQANLQQQQANLAKIAAGATPEALAPRRPRSTPRNPRSATRKRVSAPPPQPPAPPWPRPRRTSMPRKSH